MYVYTVRLRDMKDMNVIEKIAERVAKGMKPTKAQMKKLHALPMDWNEREALVRKRIKEKKEEVELKRKQMLEDLAKGMNRQWETIGEPTPHNLKFGI